MGHPMIEKILSYELWGNTGQEYFISLGVFLGLILVFGVIKKILLYRARKIAEKTETDLDDFLIDIIKNVKPPFYFVIALYVALLFLDVNALADKIIYTVFLITIAIQVAVTLQKIVDYIVKKKLSSGEEDTKDQEAIMRLISQIIKIVIWLIAALMVLSNLGIDVTSLVAGLGIGGIAVALAIQNILGDVFSSFSIFADKPFRVGDFISVGTESGVVQKVGVKTTRIKTLTGNELVVSNNDLVAARINNFKRMEKRRIAFDLGVVYGTSAEKMKKIPEIVRGIIEKTEDIEFDRCHFKSFGDFSLIFETVYFVQKPDYETYMDRQQEINMAIYEAFEKEGIEFAFPTQTIKLDKQA